jgi:hypothetical protein
LIRNPAPAGYAVCRPSRACQLEPEIETGGRGSHESYGHGLTAVACRDNLAWHVTAMISGPGSIGDPAHAIHGLIRSHGTTPTRKGSSRLAGGPWGLGRLAASVALVPSMYRDCDLVQPRPSGPVGPGWAQAHWQVRVRVTPGPKDSSQNS